MGRASRYRPVRGCEDAHFVKPPAFTLNKRPRGSKREGHRFERRVGEELDKLFDGKVVSNAWIAFDDVSFGERVCSPDHLIIDVVRGIVTVVECKLTHTKDAWKQINDVYMPVIKSMFPGFMVRGIEVCKNFEQGKDYPVDPVIITGWGKVFAGGDNVMVWRL